MKYCYRCGHPLQDNQQCCEYCSAPVENFSASHTDSRDTELHLTGAQPEQMQGDPTNSGTPPSGAQPGVPPVCGAESPNVAPPPAYGSGQSPVPPYGAPQGTPNYGPGQGSEPPYGASPVYGPGQSPAPPYGAPQGTPPPGYGCGQGGVPPYGAPPPPYGGQMPPNGVPPYGGQYAGYAGSNRPGGYPPGTVPNHMAMSIVAMVLALGSCIGLILGIVAVVSASKVDGHLAAGALYEAQNCSNTAKALSIVNFVLFGLSCLFFLIGLV